MVHFTPFIDLEGDYQGYNYRIKGDDRVQLGHPDGSTTLHNNVTNALAWIDEQVPPAPPATLDSLSPDTAVLGDPDVEMHCVGTGFTEASVIVFAGYDEPTTFNSDTDVSTIVKPSLGWGAVSVDVAVRTGLAPTPALQFTFTEPAQAGRS
jgi:hypothetical protein